VADLNSALDAAFETERGEASPAQVDSQPEPQSGSDSSPEPEAAQPAPEPAAKDDEPTGDVLFDKLNAEQIAAIQNDPRLRAAYRGLQSSYTAKMQQFAEQSRLWDALNNPQTQRHAVEALARSVGIELAPTDVPQRQQAAQVADGIETEWAQVVGPEAAQLLRPLIEKTALAAVKGTLQPIEKATEYLQMDARSRQAEAQVSQFKAAAQAKGWNLTPEVEARMAEFGQQLMPAKAIETVEDGVKHLERLYRLATADNAEADAEKRVLDRMKKNREQAEPTRTTPSTGREKRSNVSSAKNLSEALDIAMEETAAQFGLRR
jgi:hypothetical protein